MISPSRSRTTASRTAVHRSAVRGDTMGAVTAGWLRNQASANAEVETPIFRAMTASSATRSRFSAEFRIGIHHAGHIDPAAGLRRRTAEVAIGQQPAGQRRERGTTKAFRADQRQQIPFILPSQQTEPVLHPAGPLDPEPVRSP